MNIFTTLLLVENLKPTARDLVIKDWIELNYGGTPVFNFKAKTFGIEGDTSLYRPNGTLISDIEALFMEVAISITDGSYIIQLLR